jgi:hypothetical protein
MTYLVEFAARAARDLEILYLEKNVAESQAAARWFNGLERAVDALAMYPARCPAAPLQPVLLLLWPSQHPPLRARQNGGL